MSIPNFLEKIDYFCPICKKNFPVLGFILILSHLPVGEPLSGLPNEDSHSCLLVGREGCSYASQITVLKEVPLSL